MGVGGVGVSYGLLLNIILTVVNGWLFPVYDLISFQFSVSMIWKIVSTDFVN